MPEDLRAGINLIAEEAAWRKAVTTPGSEVFVEPPRVAPEGVSFGDHDTGSTERVRGRVVQGAEDPVNGVGRRQMALVEHEYEGRSVQRWYPATQLDYAEPPPAAPPAPAASPQKAPARRGPLRRPSASPPTAAEDVPPKEITEPAPVVDDTPPAIEGRADEGAAGASPTEKRRRTLFEQGVANAKAEYGDDAPAGWAALWGIASALHGGRPSPDHFTAVRNRWEGHLRGARAFDDAVRAMAEGSRRDLDRPRSYHEQRVVAGHLPTRAESLTRAERARAAEQDARDFETERTKGSLAKVQDEANAWIARGTDLEALGDDRALVDRMRARGVELRAAVDHNERAWRDHVDALKRKAEPPTEETARARLDSPPPGDQLAGRLVATLSHAQIAAFLTRPSIERLGAQTRKALQDATPEEIAAAKDVLTSEDGLTLRYEPHAVPLRPAELELDPRWDNVRGHRTIVDGVTWWGQGHFLERGEPPKAIETAEKAMPVGELVKSAAHATAALTPRARTFRASRATTPEVVYLSRSDGGMAAVSARYWDHFMARHPDAVASQGKDAIDMIAFRVGDQLVGVMMPMRGDPPPAVRAIIGPATPAPQTPKGGQRSPGKRPRGVVAYEPVPGGRPPVAAPPPQPSLPGIAEERLYWEPADAERRLSFHGRSSTTSGGAVQVTAGVRPERSRLVERMGEILSIPLRTGRMAKPRSVLGFFKVKPEVIRTRVHHDIQTLAHEAGHYVSKLLFGSQAGRATPGRRAFMRGHQVELDALARVHAKPSPEEGFAEFVRLYLTDEAAARDRAPGIFPEFEERLERLDPDLLTAFRSFRDEYGAWRAQTPTARLRAHIAFDLETPRDSLRDAMRALYTGVVNAAAPIDRAVADLAAGRTLPADQHPGVLAQTLAGAPRLVDLFLFKGRHGQGGALDFATRRKVGPSLEEILEPVRTHWQDWSTYMVARRVVELMGRDDARAGRSVEALLTALEMKPTDIRRIVNDLRTPEFDEAAEGFQAWNEALLDYIRDAGLVSAESAARIRELNQNYFPFYRVLDDPEGEGAVGRTLANVRSPVKGLQGSGRLFDNPLQGAIRNAMVFVMRAERNAVARALAELAEKTDGGGRWMERVPTEQTVTTFQLEEIRRVLRRALGASEHIREAAADLGPEPGEIGPDALLDEADLSLIARLFRPDRWKLADNEVWVLRNGEPAHYIVEPSLGRALTGLNRGDVAWLDTLLRALPNPRLLPVRSLVDLVVSGPPRLLRAGATLAPEFLGRNPFRDIFTRAAFTETPSTLPPPFGPWSDLVHAFAGFGRGLFSVLKQDEHYDAWVRGGGAISTLASLDKKHLERSLGHVLVGRAIDWRNPVEWLRAASGALEEANRVAEARGTLAARGVDPARASKADLIDAAEAAREVTIDFARSGAWVKFLAINRLVAFFNPQIQGWARMLRQARRHPSRLLWFGLSVITLQSVLLWLFQKDDPRWKEIPQWQRDISWVWLTGSISPEAWQKMTVAQRREAMQQTVWRYPKPFELGVLFGSVPERLLEWLDGQNPEIGRSLMKTFGAMVGTFLLPIPTTLEPIVANLTNYSRFLDRPIESRGLRDVEPVERYTAGTSHTARTIARGVDAVPGTPEMLRSPLQVDTLIRSWTGGLGRLTTDAIDLAVEAVTDAPPDPARTWADIPGIRGFVVRMPTAGAESIQEFYRLYGELTQVAATLRLKKKTGRDAEAYAAEHALEVRALPAFADIAKGLALTRQQMRGIYESRELSPDAKRDRLDDLTLRMMETARTAVEAYRRAEAKATESRATPRAYPGRPRATPPEK